MFQLDKRLGIELPDAEVYDTLSHEEQEQALVKWEAIRARIPDRIMYFEAEIEDLLRKVHEQEDWDIIAALFAEISDFASRINELNNWRRVDPSLHGAPAGAAAGEPEHRDREK